ncbi:SWIM-type domain-containing protein [Aphis craccivora]|uniref:SWIM-type domain-containing protein n=1 Tax=Aphis craccivora TaxID=307492 RepID=A0A6G0VLC0_APHCR|nr:SWIM-type domain-containing protein [Aphis craccivora]
MFAAPQIMFGWNIVNFTEDNTVSFVPDIWLKKNIYARPKDQKNSQKIIDSRGWLDVIPEADIK